jgi:Cytochrome c554 and c-prime
MNTRIVYRVKGTLLVKVSVCFVFFALSGGSAITDNFSTPTFQSGPAPHQDKAVQKPLDPKAWGGNHVGRPVPEYVQGDECLFCHRNDIGTTWQKNSHGMTVRKREDAPELQKVLAGQKALMVIADQIEYFLGSRHRVRFLKKEGYGRFSILNAQAKIGENGEAAKSPSLINFEKLEWNKEKFANRCAGCHATGVDPATKAFSEFGLDCYTCHGNVDLNHSSDTSLVLLSKKRRNDHKVIISLCAQCHLREGRSRSTGLPYPNNFVAGDNLFQDFEVDFARADQKEFNPGDRHVWRNVRDVALYGNESITCLSCHQVHGNSSIKHRRVLRAPICSECHEGDGFKRVKSYIVQSSLCEY